MQDFKQEENGMKPYKSFLSLAILASMVGLLMAACGKKSDDTPPPVGYIPPPPINGGVSGSPTCPAGSSFLFSTMSENTSPSMELQLQYFANASGISPIPINSPVVGGGLNAYNGPVSAVGILYVKSLNQNCPIPPGAYQLTPTQAGQMNGSASITGIMLHGNGPIQLDVAIVNTFTMDQIPAAMGTNGMQFPFRLQGRVQVRPLALPPLPGYPQAAVGCYSMDDWGQWVNYLDLIMY